MTTDLTRLVVCVLAGALLVLQPLDGIGRDDQERSGPTLTREELETIRKAKEKDATNEEKAIATDVCKKKCKQCFDGQACDFECAEKNCGGTSAEPQCVELGN